MASDEDSDESDESESIDSDQSSMGESRPTGFYFRAVRWLLLLSLVPMGVVCLYMFTTDATNLHYQLEALYVSLCSLALVGLGIYGAYHVRIYYVLLFSVLMLLLMIYKTTSGPFQQVTMLHSVTLHTPYLMALFSGFALSCLAIFSC